MTDQAEEDFVVEKEKINNGQRMAQEQPGQEIEGDIETEKETAGASVEKPSEQKPTAYKKAVVKVAPKKIPVTVDPITIKIEKVLSEGLNEVYQKLSPVAKQEFKIKGEATAGAIKELLLSTKVQTKKILALIINWLKMLPGVNRFFLEQEAKIKTDKLLALRKYEQEKERQKII